MLRVGIVAGEASGDLLGSDLIRSIREIEPEVTFEGIGGPHMVSSGCKTLFPMEKLAVMGLFEVAGSFLELVSIRKKLISHFRANPPDIFIGIDAPDFNLTLEQRLRDFGIKTVHYVGPTVWAWRAGRLNKIKKAVDLMLVLFPFEVPIYQDHSINVKLVRHPAVDNFLPVEDKSDLKQKLGIEPEKKVIAIMPGSRKTEIDRILPVQLSVARELHRKNPGLVFISSALTQQAMNMMNEHLLTEKGGQEKLDFRLFEDQSREVLSIADVGLLASGTVTLEAMLCQLPMVVMYKMNWLSFKIIKSLANINLASLPNLLAGKELVPEFLQEQCDPEQIVPVISGLLAEDKRQAQIVEFKDIASQFKQADKNLAANAVLNLI